MVTGTGWLWISICLTSPVEPVTRSVSPTKGSSSSGMDADRRGFREWHGHLHMYVHTIAVPSMYVCMYVCMYIDVRMYISILL